MLAGARLWLRADLGVTLNGGNVEAWADQALGDGSHDLSQGTAANRPLWVAADAAAKGRPYVDFDQSNDLLVAGAAGDWTFLHSGAGCTVFYVARAKSTTDSFGYNLTTWGPAVGDDGFALIYDPIQDYWRALIRNASSQNVVNANTGAGTVVGDAIACVIFRYLEGRAGNEFDLTLNGVSRASGNSAFAPSAGAAQALHLGARAFTVPDAHANEWVYDSVIWPSYLTDAEVQRLTTYSRARYGSP